MVKQRRIVPVNWAATWGVALLFSALLTPPVRAAVLLDQLISGALGEQMSQTMTDYPESSIYAFDDFTVTGASWTVNRVTAYVYDYSTNDAAIEDIRLTFTDKAEREPGNVGYVGRLVRPGVAATLVFDLPNVVLPAGKHWLSAWVKGPYDGTDPDGDHNANVIVEVRWRLTTPVRGSQFYLHNPGGGWGYGTAPLPGSVAYGSASDLAFLIEGTKNVAPTVAAWSPKGLNVATTANLTAAFSTSMIRTSVNNALTINGVKASTFGGKFTWTGNKLVFNPTNNLAAGTSYKVVLGTGAKSAAGVNLAKAFTWTFKTKPAAPSPITVASASTAAGAQITVSLSVAAAVTVTVRNLAGREVAVLTPGELAAGVQTLLWDGKSKSGTRVPAGLYLVQVEANTAGGSSTQAMTSLRLR